MRCLWDREVASIQLETCRTGVADGKEEAFLPHPPCRLPSTQQYILYIAVVNRHSHPSIGVGDDGENQRHTEYRHFLDFERWG